MVFVSEWIATTGFFGEDAQKENDATFTTIYIAITCTIGVTRRFYTTPRLAYLLTITPQRSGGKYETTLATMAQSITVMLLALKNKCHSYTRTQ